MRAKLEATRRDCEEKTHKIQVLRLDNDDLRKRVDKLKRKINGVNEKDLILSKKAPSE